MDTSVLAFGAGMGFVSAALNVDYNSHADGFAIAQIKRDLAIVPSEIIPDIPMDGIVPSEIIPDIPQSMRNPSLPIQPLLPQMGFNPSSLAGLAVAASVDYAGLAVAASVDYNSHADELAIGNIQRDLSIVPSEIIPETAMDAIVPDSVQENSMLQEAFRELFEVSANVSGNVAAAMTDNNYELLIEVGNIIADKL